MKLRRIIQNDRFGCGLACVAMLAGITYRQACTAADERGWYAEIRRSGTSTRQMRMLLADCGVLTDKARRIKSWNKFSEIGLIGTQNHWLVFQRQAGKECVLDPNPRLKQGIRTDFRRILPKMFVSVTSVRDQKCRVLVLPAQQENAPNSDRVSNHSLLDYR